MATRLHRVAPRPRCGERVTHRGPVVEIRRLEDLDVPSGGVGAECEVLRAGGQDERIGEVERIDQSSGGVVEGQTGRRSTGDGVDCALEIGRGEGGHRAGHSGQAGVKGGDVQGLKRTGLGGGGQLLLDGTHLHLRSTRRQLSGIAGLGGRGDLRSGGEQLRLRPLHRRGGGRHRGVHAVGGSDSGDVVGHHGCDHHTQHAQCDRRGPSEATDPTGQDRRPIRTRPDRIIVGIEQVVCVLTVHGPEGSAL